MIAVLTIAEVKIGIDRVAGMYVPGSPTGPARAAKKKKNNTEYPINTNKDTWIDK